MSNFYSLNASDVTIVKYSPIHGNGLFSAEKIPSNRLITIISGEVINEKEALRREYEEGNVFIFWNDNNYIDTSRSSKIKYINHHCNPNCIIDDYNSDSLALYSLKEIEPGEELTIDYGYDEIYEYCRCNTCMPA